MTVLDATRKRGWAKTNEEDVRGVVDCAVPILSPDRELIACLAVSVPMARAVQHLALSRRHNRRAAAHGVAELFGSPPAWPAIGVLR